MRLAATIIRRGRERAQQLDAEAGMATAEYAVGTVAAVALTIT